MIILVNLLLATIFFVILVLTILTVSEVLYYGIIGSGSAINTESSAIVSLILSGFLILATIGGIILFAIKKFVFS